MNKYINDIHFSVHSILVDKSLKTQFYQWAKGEDYNDTIPLTLDPVYSPIRKSDIPDTIKWTDVVDYIERIPLKEEFNKVAIEAQEKLITRMECAEELFDKFLHEGINFGSEVEIEEKWNKSFNSFNPVDYESFDFDIQGMSHLKDSKYFELYEQQVKGIAFLCTKGNGLLAYDVGVGKTACGICAAIYQMQHGKCNRPLIIVPNAVYTKWIHDIKELFPLVKINPVHNFNKSYLERIIIEDNSLTICTSEALANFYFKESCIETWINEDFKYILSEKKQKSIFTKPENDENAIYFENFHFDLLVIDEAHRYKNLIKKTANTGKYTEFSKLGFGEPSLRAIKMYAVTQYIHHTNNNQNVFLLTATPFTNSPMEIYSMLLFIGGNKLPQMGYKTINDFLDEFAEITIEWAVDNKGEVKQKIVMKKFRSLFALQNIIRDNIDKISADDANIKRPEKITHVEKINMTELQRMIYKREIDRLESSERKLSDIFLAMNNMRMSLLSPVLVKNIHYDFPIPSIEDFIETSPKLKLVCRCVIDCYKEKPTCGQIIYMPRGVKESQILKKYLVENGIPEKAIGLINATVTDLKKDKLTADFNDPKKILKIIIGSETISEGIDLNGNTITLYNCMLGWNPSEPIQVEGRLWRQGNLQDKVHIIYPIVYNSIDSLIYQKHDEKEARIDAIWSYRGDKLNVEEIKPEELKIELIQDPEKKAGYLIEKECLPIKRNLSVLKDKLELANAAIKEKEELQKKQENIKKEIEDLYFYHRKTSETMIRILNNNLAQYTKKYEKLCDNYQKMINSFLAESELENTQVIKELENQKEKEETKLKEINTRKFEIIQQLKEEEKHKHIEEVFDIEDIADKLVKEICKKG